MSSPKNDLQQRLAYYRQIKLSVTGRKSGRTVSVPVWFVLDGEKLYLLPVQGSETQWYKNVLQNPSIWIEARGSEGEFQAAPVTAAKVGIYGLMAFAVSQRTQEIGLRMALGASQNHVLRLIVREASELTGVGLGLGFAGAVLVGRTMHATLYGVGTMDFSVIAAVAVVLFVTALLAAYLPARRAASIDPMQALRTD